MEECTKENCCESKPIAKEFCYHKPSPAGMDTMTHFREEFSKLLLDIRSKVTSCPETTLVTRHLEIASMFLNKAINLGDADAEPVFKQERQLKSATSERDGSAA